MFVMVVGGCGSLPYLSTVHLVGNRPFCFEEMLADDASLLADDTLLLARHAKLLINHVVKNCWPMTLFGPFRLAKKSEFVNAEFVDLFPTRGLINWFLKLALTTISTSSLYSSIEARVKGVPQNPESANLFETEITDVISNMKVFDVKLLLANHRRFPGRPERSRAETAAGTPAGRSKCKWARKPSGRK
jgi:hypothetical protein